MVDLSKVEAEAPGLVKLAKEAGVSLAKQGVPDGMRAAVYLLLDHSGSMRPYYWDGSVQMLAEQALGLAVHLDDDGTVPTIFFGSGASAVHDIALADYEGAVDRLHAAERWGSTNLAAGMRAVAEHYRAHAPAVPALVIVQTDGRPNSVRRTEQVMAELSDLPLFWSFVGFGDHVQFLYRLDEMQQGCRVDNASMVHAVDPWSMSDDELYDGLLRQFPDWLESAGAAGILP